MQQLLRQATPLILLGLALLVCFENFIPGHEFVEQQFGRDFVLRFVLGLLCLYMVMLMVDRARLEHAFKQLLEAFKQFHEQMRGGGGVDRGKQLEAVELLIGALQSSDPAVRQTSAEHLRRITGESYGEEPAAWRAWLRAQRDASGATASVDQAPSDQE